jgi:DNA-binding NtrC family response regulator
VLVCDDEAGARLSLKLMLDEQCTLVLTGAPTAALDAARAQRFDCAVIDWSMPDPNRPSSRRSGEAAGGKLLYDLQALDKDLSVIVWTAYDDATCESAMRLGAFSTMSKPVDPEIVEREVRAATAATRARRAAPASATI